MSDKQAFTIGTIAGIAEVAMEKISLGAWLEGDMSEGALRYVLRNAFSEGVEETGTGIANLLADVMIAGDKSEWNTAMQAYIDQGKTKKEAFGLVAAEQAAKIGLDALGGFLSGSTIGGGTSAAAKVYGAAAGNNVAYAPLPAAQKSQETAIQDAGRDKASASESVTAVKENGVTQSNTANKTKAISKPLNSYPAEKQQVIRSYLRAVDERIKSFVQSVKEGDLRFKRQKIADVSERAALDIGNLLNVDVHGYTHNINTNGVQHILNRHGENGKQDTSMALDDDIARVGWVLENYDSVELLTEKDKQVYSSSFLDKNHNPAPQIRFRKKIDGTYYVVEAVYENDYKKIWVQSAYLQKSEDVTQASAEGRTTDHGANAQSALASPSSSNSIHNNGKNVNADTDPVVGWDGREVVKAATGPSITVDGKKYQFLGYDAKGSPVYQDARKVQEMETAKAGVRQETAGDRGQENDPTDKNAGNSLEKSEKDSTIIHKLTYDEVKTVHNYMSAQSYTINGKLREGIPLSAEETAFKDNLNVVLEKTPTYSGNLQRSLFFDDPADVQSFLADYRPGACIKYKEFISTTKGESQYNPEGQVQILILDSKKGRDISSINEKEQEVLYKTDSEFVVVGISGSNGKYYIYLEEQ